MNDARNARLGLPAWWWYYAFAVSIVAVASLILGVAGVYTNGRQDAVAAAENKVRDQQNRALLDCFDDFASDLAGGLPPVREATAATNDALASALTALRVGLEKVGTDEFEASDLRLIIARFAAYQSANDHLVQVRKNNPYPDSPSVTCATRSTR